jgi:4-hydroxyacetophenone monooxygenase
MGKQGYFDWDPISGDDAVLRDALEHLNAPVMMAVLVHLTGDLGLLDGDIQIDLNASRDLQCGIGEPDQARVRGMAFAALKSYRDQGCPSLDPLDGNALRRILNYLTGRDPGQDYVDFLLEEAEFEAEDAYGVQGFDAIPEEVRRDFHVVIVGAGMSGLLAGYRLKEAGISFTIVERSADVGGTWLDNRYPGCRVDSPSHVYEYSFARNDWPQYYCTQPVLKDYFSRCATEFGLRPHIRFEHEVEGADYDAASGTWRVSIRDKTGESDVLEANAFICATGQLNQPKMPDIPGMEDFDGPSFHTARWDESVDLKGKRVLVIGSGATCMQLTPEVAQEAASLTIFQRTPPWIFKSPRYRDSVPEGEHWLINHVPYYARWYHFLLFWLDAEGAYASVVKDPAWSHQDRSVSAANEALRDLMIAQMKEDIGGDAALADVLVPHHAPGGKRPLVDDGTWYRTLKQDHVHLVTEPIERITASGVLTADGAEHEADVLIYATGFHASRFLFPMTILGREGRDLRAHWGDDPRAYLGMVVPGFPNLFILYGPNTNIVVTGSIVFFSECSTQYILGCIKLLLERGLKSLEVDPDVFDAFNDMVDEGNLNVAWGAENVKSWYKNKAGRVTQNWPFKLLGYWTQTRSPDPDDFHLQ